MGSAHVAILAVALGAGGVVAQDGRSLVVSSDPELAALANELLTDLAERSGMELREPVRLEKRSRAELVRYLESKLEEELPEEEAAVIVEAYSLLGLVPPDLDLRDVLMTLYTEQVAGFYEPDSTALFVMDDQPEVELEGLLLHELVHAVQDQTADLDVLTDPDLGNDRATAARAAIEGHATLVMLEYILEQQMGSAVDLSELPAFGPTLRQGLAAVPSQFPALDGTPTVLQQSLIFPYIEGAAYLQALWAQGERVVPFGENLPLSTEQIFAGAGTEPPIELTLDVSGGTVVHEDVLGWLELGVLLQEHVGEAGNGLADGWDGDRYVLVEAPEGRRALIAFILWEEEASRDEFVELIGGALDRFGAAAEVESVDVVGRPATRLTVGPADGITVRVSEAPSG